MIEFIIGLVVGLTPTLVLLIKKFFAKKPPEIPRYSRRGLYTNEYAVSSMGVKKYDVTVQFEVGELESTDDLSKIEVISCIASQSSSNSEKDRKEFSDMVNNSWVSSNQIKWITTTASKRNDKIDQILNNG